MKKIIALVLALAMILMIGSAFADGEGSITVTNLQNASGEDSTTYEAYRIFNITALKDPETDEYVMNGQNKYASMSYTINNDWTAFFGSNNAGAKYIVDENNPTANSNKGYTPIVINNQVKYIALTESNVSTFAKEAFEFAQKTSIAPVATNTDGKFKDLALGYYMIYPKGANINVGEFTSIVSLTSTNPNATVIQKAKYPTLEKTDDDDSVEVGQTVHYTLTSTVPDTTGYETFSFTFHDQMTAGLTFDGEGSISVVIENGENDVIIPATGDNSYTFATETPGNGYATAFKIDIPVMAYQNYIGKTINVTYTATVNDNAVRKIDKNHATLEYSRNPKDESEKTTTPPDEERVYSAGIKIDKFDATNTSAKLKGAKFVLRCKSVRDSDNEAHAVPGSYYKYTPADEEAGTKAKVEWVAETDIDTRVTNDEAALESDVKNGATIVTTNESGEAFFNGLENGVYEVIEVAAPLGYNQIKGVATTVDINYSSVYPDNTLSYVSSIANNSGTELPHTGGIGTTIFYILGGLLVVGAAVILVARRKAQD